MADAIHALLRRWRARTHDEARIDRAYAAWLARQPAPDGTAPAAAPAMDIVMPVCDPRPEWLDAAIASVRAQSHAGWTLRIADDASQSAEVLSVLARHAADDPRLDVVHLPARSGISAASNAALARAGSNWVAFLDHDDLLAPHALAAVARELARAPHAVLVFSDEDQLIGGRRARPYFKFGWNPDLLLAQNFVCHLAVYKREAVRQAGGLRPALDGSQDYDLALRVALNAPAGAVRHIPDILYHWRQSPESFSAASGRRCAEAAWAAAQQAAGPLAHPVPDGALPQWRSLSFAPPDPAPQIAILRGPEAPPPNADLLIFLAPGVEPPALPGWWHPLAGLALQPGIGAAGARLDDPAGRPIGAGAVLGGPNGAAILTGGPDPDDPGYRGLFRLPRTVSALNEGAVAVRRDVFTAAGGFANEAGDFRLVDLCLRLGARGLRSVWTPHVRVRGPGRASPPLRDGAAWMRARWGAALNADPYMNPGLSLRSGRLTLRGGA